MRLLVLGGNGQLGSEWRHLPDFTPEGGDVELDLYGSEEADITNRKGIVVLLDREQPDVVINCAAYTAVDRAESERDRALLVNATAPGWLAESCARNGTVLVHYSTDYVFPGRAEDRERRSEGYREEDRIEPVNWYGETKWRGEEAVRDSGCRHLILRLSWLCGRYGGNFVKAMLRLGRSREGLKVVDDQWGSPTYAFHVVTSTLALLRAEKEGTLHITSEGLLTWCDFARAIFDLAGLEVDLKAVTSEEFPSEADRPSFSKLCTDKLAGIPGVEMLDWKRGLQKLLTQLDETDGNY